MSLLLRQALALDLRGNGQVSRALQQQLPDDIQIRSVRDTKQAWFYDAAGHEVFVDCTAPCYDGAAAEAWIKTLERRLAAGVPVVTCNKAPLALAWDRLASHGTPILHAATVGGGTPIVPVLERLAGQGITQIEAGLSGTLAFVLDRVWNGHGLDDAVAEAQAAGFAEPDPSLDLDGTDALAKAVILHNRFLHDTALSLADLPRCELDVQAIRGFDRTPHLVLTIRPGNIDWQLTDAPWVDAGADGPGSAAIRVTTQDGAVFRLAGPGAGPAATAANMLADLRRLQEAPWPS